MAAILAVLLSASVVGGCATSVSTSAATGPTSSHSSAELPAATKALSVRSAATGPGLTVRVQLATTTAPAGQVIRGTLTVTNNTGRAIPTPCEGWFEVGLTNSQVTFDAAWAAPMCAGTPIAAGSSTFPIDLRTRYDSCVPHPTSPAVRACLAGSGDEIMPPLPAGDYHTVVDFALPTGAPQQPAAVDVVLT